MLTAIAAEFKDGDSIDRIARSLVQQGCSSADVYAARKLMPAAPEHFWMSITNRMSDIHGGIDSGMRYYAKMAAKAAKKLG